MRHLVAILVGDLRHGRPVGKICSVRTAYPGQVFAVQPHGTQWVVLWGKGKGFLHLQAAANEAGPGILMSISTVPSSWNGWAMWVACWT